MKTNWKKALILISMFLLVGLTACDQAEKTTNDVTETATQTVDTAKAKAIEMFDGVTEKKDTEEKSGEEKEGEVKKK